MIILRQKEFARAIPKEVLVRELERRGFRSGASKYISEGFRTVKNPSYVKESEAAFQRLQNQGRSMSTGKYKDLGINQKINLKGTLEHRGGGQYSTNLTTGGEFKWKNKKASRKRGYVDHPSRLLDGQSALKVAKDNNWILNKAFYS